MTEDLFAIEADANVKRVKVELDEGTPFFAPVQSDAIDALLGQYGVMRDRMGQMAEVMQGAAYREALTHFIEGNADDRRLSAFNLASTMFDLDGGIKALNAHYWHKALNMTDVMECMPAKRREEWNEQIQKLTAPEFNEDTVRPTIARMLASRQQFLAERVDGIFRRLSPDHVTNAPEGFRNRLILNYVLCGYGYVRHETAAYIHDLRCVVAKFMGRAEPRWRLTNDLLDSMRHDTGKWVTIDGGAIRVRLYKKGTAHLEVHPDMAWRLNQVLAFLHPQAIPSEFRTKPKRAPKAFATLRTALPFDVLELLAAGRSRDTEYRFDYASKDDAAYERAGEILASIGGVRHPKDRNLFQFDYPVGAVIRELIDTGCLPEQKSHQFYATPEVMGHDVAELADIGDTDEVLEPSAGQGGLAKHLPIERTTCVELSQLHCEILRAKGYSTVHADFLEWAATTPQRFTRCVMNPPFSKGRALLHLQAAASLMAPSARLVAILPATLRGQAVLPGWQLEWSAVRQGEFADTGVGVVILVATRHAG